MSPFGDIGSRTDDMPSHFFSNSTFFTFFSKHTLLHPITEFNTVSWYCLLFFTISLYASDMKHVPIFTFRVAVASRVPFWLTAIQASSFCLSVCLSYLSWGSGQESAILIDSYASQLVPSVCLTFREAVASRVPFWLTAIQASSFWWALMVTGAVECPGWVDSKS